MYSYMRRANTKQGMASNFKYVVKSTERKGGDAVINVQSLAWARQRQTLEMACCLHRRRIRILIDMWLGMSVSGSSRHVQHDL